MMGPTGVRILRTNTVLRCRSMDIVHLFVLQYLSQWLHSPINLKEEQLELRTDQEKPEVLLQGKLLGGRLGVKASQADDWYF